MKKELYLIASSLEERMDYMEKQYDEFSEEQRDIYMALDEELADVYRRVEEIEELESK